MGRTSWRLIVHGRVQGVGYRQATVRAARALGLRGYAMNAADGTVVIEAEGSAADLHKLEEWCRTGPPLAQVERVERGPGESHGAEDFTIKR